MGNSDKKTSWLTIVLSAVLSAVLSFVVSYLVTNHTFRLNQEAQMERAAKYADKLEAKLELELGQRWESFRTDSLHWERARADSIEVGESDLSSRHLLQSSARSMLRDRINRKFDSMIEDSISEIKHFEDLQRLEIETIRETGVLLK